MECPACKSNHSHMEEIETDLCATRCKDCNGHWLTLDQYLRWIKKQPKHLEEKPLTDIALQSAEDSTPKLCPDCDKLLLRYKVGHSLDFSVEHCGHCGGIWLDGNEWAILKEKNLHDDIHKIFSTPWQRQIIKDQIEKRKSAGQLKTKEAAEEQRAKIQNALRGRFGVEVFEKAEEIRLWLKEQNEKAVLLKFIADDDPFSH